MNLSGITACSLMASVSVNTPQLCTSGSRSRRHPFSLASCVAMFHVNLISSHLTPGGIPPETKLAEIDIPWRWLATLCGDCAGIRLTSGHRAFLVSCRFLQPPTHRYLQFCTPSKNVAGSTQQFLKIFDDNMLRQFHGLRPADFGARFLQGLSCLVRDPMTLTGFSTMLPDGHPLGKGLVAAAALFPPAEMQPGPPTESGLPRLDLTVAPCQPLAKVVSKPL